MTVVFDENSIERNLNNNMQRYYVHYVLYIWEKILENLSTSIHEQL